MKPPSSASFLAGMALLILGGVAAGMLAFPIPPANEQSITFILGAIAGALSMQGTSRAPGPTPPDPPPKET